MKIESKFDLGQTVWPIWSGRKDVTLTCGFCEGIGKITGADDHKTSCPKCYGRKTETQWEDEAWFVNPSMTIGQVRIAITDSPGRDGEEVFDNYKPQKERKEEYMCVETGINTGSVWNAEKLFATEAEAQSECDRRNKAEGKT